MNLTLDSMSLDLIRKFSRKAHDYERTYTEGLKAGRQVEEVVKKYKSCRRVFLETIFFFVVLFPPDFLVQLFVTVFLHYTSLYQNFVL